jgi:hypothetical protein
MDTTDLAAEKRRLEDVFCREIKAFEKKTGMAVTGMKIKRLDNAAACPDIEFITLKAVIPDTLY